MQRMGSGREIRLELRLFGLSVFRFDLSSLKMVGGNDSSKKKKQLKFIF